jgi:heptosyltransferase II
MTPSKQTLIFGVNWLGDSCMAMPAIQTWKNQHPDHKLTMLIKPPLQPLWQCHRAIDQIIALSPGHMGPHQNGASPAQE